MCNLHFEQARAALLAGKHVIITKPFAVSLDEARDLVALAEKTGRILLVAQSLRWNGRYRAIHELYEKGELGDIIMAESYYMHDKVMREFDVAT